MTSSRLSNDFLHSSMFPVPAQHAVILKAENMAEKLEWMAKLRYCIGAVQGLSIKAAAPEFDSSGRFSSAPESSGVNVLLRKYQTRNKGHIVETIVLILQFLNQFFCY